MGADVIFDWEPAVKAGMELYTREVCVGFDGDDNPINESVTKGSMAGWEAHYTGNKGICRAKPEVLAWLNQHEIRYGISC